ncbi:MAG: autotransporter domain-containing protein [Planctomycetes bacterium]|nr:autotransporter domain-containing protein [Planctomycetota bacterium]
MTVDNSAGAANEYTFTGAGLAATGAFTKNGEGTVTFNQTDANAFTSASLNAGRVNLKRADALGNGEVTLGGAVLGLADALNLANTVAVSEDSSVAVETGENATISGIVSGAGTLVKSGEGALTLTGTNTHTGDIRLAAGTLMLTGTGSIASSGNLVMEAGTTFDISGLGGSATVRNISLAGGATIVGGGNVLDMTGDGNTLSFDLTDGIAGGPALVDGGGALQVGSSTILNLLPPTLLEKGEQIVLAENLHAASEFAAGIVKSNHMKYDVQMDDTYSLLATFLGVASYREETDEYFAPLGMVNTNVQNGTTYLDWLSDLDAASFDQDVMKALDKAYTDSFNLGGRNASLALQQLFGAAVVYNAAAQSVSGSRFRQLLGNRNAGSVINGLVFAGASQAYLNDAGIASEGAVASIRYGARDTVPVGRSTVWASGFGAWAKQDSSAAFAGFKFDAQGAAIGYEYTLANRLQLGVAVAYSRGDLKVSDLRYESKPDIMNLAVYGAYAHESGFYVQGSLGYGHAWNDYTTNMILGGRKTGKYGSDEWSANVELGYVARLPENINLVPSVGLEYAHLRNSGWTERLSGNPALVANRFDGGHDSSVGIPVGFRLNKLFPFGCNGGYIAPEVRASWVYMANESRTSVTAGFTNAPGSTTMRGIDTGSNSWRLGAGLSGRFNERVDFRVDYDFNTRNGFHSHNVMASMGLSF